MKTTNHANKVSQLQIQTPPNIALLDTPAALMIEKLTNLLRLTLHGFLS